MTPATNKQITKQVRAIIKKHYDYWSTFNDLRADKKTRRIKCMRNGYDFGQQYDAWAAAIQADLDAAGITYSEAGFYYGDCWRGGYTYFSVVLPA